MASAKHPSCAHLGRGVEIEAVLQFGNGKAAIKHDKMRKHA
jgi:hypothetical protein